MASYDFNNPAVGSNYTSFPGEIRKATDSLAKMLDGTSDTNVPTGAKRKNSGQKYRLEEWDGANWNMKEPGLGDLTQAEVNQLATIGATTISAAQWGYLGGLPASPLHQNNLAAKGGELLQKSVDETVNATYTFNPGSIPNTVHEYKNNDNGHGIQLRFAGNGPNLSWIPRDFSGTLLFSNSFDYEFDNARWTFGAPVIGSGVAGGGKGSGTANFVEVWDNGNRVYSASNAPASTALSDHASQVVTLGGDFDAGQDVRCERIGNWVTITGIGVLTHASNSSASSATGVIPSQFRPSSTEVQNVYSASGTEILVISVGSSGQILTYYKSSVDGTSVSNLSTGFAPTISYLIT